TTSLAESLSASDVHLVSLRPTLEGLIVPSKFYGIAAAGRPSIFIGDKDGEIARLIARIGCGFTVAMGDSQGLAQTILKLAGDPELCQQMRRLARLASEDEFAKSIAISRWEMLLASLCYLPADPIVTSAQRAGSCSASGNRDRRRQSPP